MSEFKEITIKARVISSKDELDNMMKKDNLRNYTKDDWLIVAKYVDKETFQPCVIVALKDPNEPFVNWMMFATTMELSEEVK
jgi:hypothetical protein